MENPQERYRRLMLIAEEDREYLWLKQKLEKKCDDWMDCLSEKDRDFMMEIIGLQGELDTRLMELACFL